MASYTASKKIPAPCPEAPFLNPNVSDQTGTTDIWLAVQMSPYELKNEFTSLGFKTGTLIGWCPAVMLQRWLFIVGGRKSLRML